MEKPREKWALYKRLLGYVRPYRSRLIAGIVFGVLYGPANGVVLQVVRKAWAWAFESNWSYPWWQMVGIAALLPVAMMARGAFDFMGTYLLNWVGLRVVMDLRVRVFEHLESLSLDFFTGAQTGELISRVTNDVGRLPRRAGLWRRRRGDDRCRPRTIVQQRDAGAGGRRIG